MQLRPHTRESDTYAASLTHLRIADEALIALAMLPEWAAEMEGEQSRIILEDIDQEPDGEAKQPVELALRELGSLVLWSGGVEPPHATKVLAGVSELKIESISQYRGILLKAYEKLAESGRGDILNLFRTACTLPDAQPAIDSVITSMGQDMRVLMANAYLMSGSVEVVAERFQIAPGVVGEVLDTFAHDLKFVSIRSRPVDSDSLVNLRRLEKHPLPEWYEPAALAYIRGDKKQDIVSRFDIRPAWLAEGLRILRSSFASIPFYRRPLYYDDLIAQQNTQQPGKVKTNSQQSAFLSMVYAPERSIYTPPEILEMLVQRSVAKIAEQESGG